MGLFGNEPSDQAGAQQQAERDRQNGTKTDTQQWSDAQRQNYNNHYGNGGNNNGNNGQR